MITITKGQKVVDYPQFVVVSPSGDYKEEDLIVCAEDDTPGKPSCMFQAQLVAYGNIVYSSNEPITPAQIADVAAEQERQAEANQADQGTIIEAESVEPENTIVNAPATQAEEAPALSPEEPVPSMEIVTEEAPATQNMSTTTPATTTESLPPIDTPATSTPAVSEPAEALNAEE